MLLVFKYSGMFGPSPVVVCVVRWWRWGWRRWWRRGWRRWWRWVWRWGSWWTPSTPSSASPRPPPTTSCSYSAVFHDLQGLLELGDRFLLEELKEEAGRRIAQHIDAQNFRWGLEIKPV